MSNRVIEIYSEYNNTYDITDPRIVGWSNQESLNKRLSVTKKYIDYKNNESILDFGCGTMLSLWLALDRPENYIGYDINQRSVEIALSYYDTTVTSDRSMIDLFTYDIIVVNGVFQDYQDKKSILNELVNLSKLMTDNGRLLFITPSNNINSDSNSELFLSPFDAMMICEQVNLPYIISVKELGKHIVCMINNKKEQ